MSGIVRDRFKKLLSRLAVDLTAIISTAATIFIHAGVICMIGPAHAGELRDGTLVAELATSNKNYHAAGIQAFNAGDYPKAIAFLEKAFTQDSQNPKLIFNLASAYYKAGEFENAFRYYPRLIPYPSYKPIAFYHLGLTAIKMEQYRNAIHWFRKTIASTSNESMIKLSKIAIKRINESEQAQIRKKNWRINIAVSGGYDDNVSLANFDIGGIQEKKDNFVNVSTGASGYAMGDVKNGLFTIVNYHNRSYQEETDYDFTIASGKLAYDFRVNKYYNRIFGQYQQVDLGDNDYQDIVSGGIHTQALLPNRSWLKFNYQFSRYQAGANLYNYLDGSQHLFFAEIRKKNLETDYRIKYQLEFNDRDNLYAGTQYFDASPVRHTLSARFKILGDYHWDIFTEFNFRKSIYDQNNIFIDGSSKQREDDRSSIALVANLWLSQHWLLRTTYQYTDNSSNIPIYTYDRTLANIGIIYKY